MDRPPATLLARESWSLGVQAIYAMPRLFGGTFALLLAFGAVFRWQHPPGVDLAMPATRLLGYASDLATEVIIAGAMIAVYRSVLLREVRDRPVWALPPHYDRFLLWTLLLNLPLLPAVALQAVTGDSKVATAVELLLTVAAFAVALVLLVRLAVLLPLVSADAAGAGWRGAWAMSRGHAWRFIAVGFLTFLPLEVAAYAATRLLNDLGGPAAFLAGATFDAAKALLLGAIGAAMWSRLVQVYGGAPPRPAAPW